MESTHERVRGDARILELLIKKEDEATKNIGDPAALMGKYDQDAEEALETPAKAIRGRRHEPLARNSIWRAGHPTRRSTRSSSCFQDAQAGASTLPRPNRTRCLRCSADAEAFAQRCARRAATASNRARQKARSGSNA